jgi:hypothetical protein
MAHTVTCPNCQRVYAMKPELAGKRAKCKCGGRIEFPALVDELGEADLLDDAPPAPARKGRMGAEPLEQPANPYGRTVAAPPVVRAAAACTGCGEPLAPGAVICVHCGTNQKTGAVMKTQVATAPPARAIPQRAPAKPAAKDEAANDEDEGGDAYRAVFAFAILGIGAPLLDLFGWQFKILADMGEGAFYMALALGVFAGGILAWKKDYILAGMSAGGSILTFVIRLMVLRH